MFNHKMQHCGFQIMHTILLDVVDDFHREWFVPATIQEEPEVVHLQQIARWRLILRSWQNRELNYWSHFLKRRQMASVTQTTQRKKRTAKACPNPLFEKWLEEWKKEAQERGLNSVHTYRKVCEAGAIWNNGSKFKFWSF